MAIGIMGMGFYLNACSFSSRATQKLLLKAEKETYDVIVVPGVPLENGKWSRIMKARVYWSKYLFDKGIAKNIMYSGSSVYSPYAEAEVMALYGEALGIPKENIYTETLAEHSTENIYYGYKKSKSLNFDKIALASDPFQTKMLKRFIRKKVSPEVGLIPIVFDTLRKMEPEMTDPEINYEKLQVKNFESITKREGFWKRFRGTMGKNIDKEAYQ